MKDTSELIEQWRKENRAHCLEGSRGIENFEKLVKVIGYKDGNFFNDALRNFLYDNSGALEALVEWIGNSNVPEWNDALQDEVGHEDEEQG